MIVPLILLLAQYVATAFNLGTTSVPIILKAHSFCQFTSEFSGCTTPAMNCSGANFMVLSVENNTSSFGTISSTSISSGNFHTSTLVGGVPYSKLFRAWNQTLSGSEIVTAGTDGDFTSVFAACYSGLLTTDPRDNVMGPVTGSSSASVNTGPGLPRQNNVLICSGMSDGDVTVLTPPVLTGSSTVVVLDSAGTVLGQAWGGGLACAVQSPIAGTLVANWTVVGAPSGTMSVVGEAYKGISAGSLPTFLDLGKGEGTGQLTVATTPNMQCSLANFIWASASLFITGSGVAMTTEYSLDGGATWNPMTYTGFFTSFPAAAQNNTAYAANVSGTNTVKVHVCPGTTVSCASPSSPDGSGYPQVSAECWSHIAPSNPVDTTNDSSGSNTCSGASVTPSADNYLVTAQVGNVGGTPPTITSPFLLTSSDAEVSGMNVGGGGAHILLPVPSLLNPTWSYSGGGACNTAVFKHD